MSFNKPEDDINDVIEESFRASQRIARNYFENISGYQHDLRDMATTFTVFVSKVWIDPQEVFKMQACYMDYLLKQQQLFTTAFTRSDPDTGPPNIVQPSPEDKRFKAPEWNEQPLFAFIKQNYLLATDLTRNLIRTVDIEEKQKRKILFYVNQYLDALSPSNFPGTNPEVIKLTTETKGENFRSGFRNLLADIKNGRISQTDHSAYEVGKNLATTPGDVIYQNELIQLIQYQPSGKEVYENPLLIIPPWINKYYIFDLQPENSFVRFLVDKGHTVFIISWKNPDPSMHETSFDDYVAKGILKASEVIQSVANGKKINMLGYCLGGTLLGVALAVMHARKNVPVESATFLATMLDFSDVGPMGDVIDHALVRKLERGELQRQGVMHGHDMEKAFNLIRANDLVWYFVINNYLKGNTPRPFDVLYWTNDNTNLPAKMYSYYLRQMVLENKLSRKNALRICDAPIDLAQIKTPAFVFATREDHISPAKTVFTTTDLLSGPVEFMLGDSGHVLGVANPPSRKKYGYSRFGKTGAGFEAWKESAQYFTESWWIPWSEWLSEHSGGKVKAPQARGNKEYAAIEPAPGSYVMERCNVCATKFF